MKIPQVIPPRSTVRLIRFDDATAAWAADLGREFRIGYYRPSVGLNTIWLVNNDGRYEQSIDRDYLLKYFDIIRLAREDDLYGVNRPVLGKRRLR